MWASEGIKSQAVAGTVLADTGQVAAGLSTYTILIWSQQNVAFTVHQRNANDDGDIQSQKISPISGFVSIPMPMTLSMNQRVTVTVDEDMALEAQASILL